MNPIAKTLNRHKKANKEIEALAASIRKLYTGARININQRLIKSVREKRDPFAAKNLIGLIEELQEIYGGLEADFRAQFGKTMPRVVSEYVKAAESDMHQTVLGKFDTGRMKLMLNDAYTHIAGATQNMCKTDVQFLRQASAEIFREASLTGITRKEASEKLLTQMMARPEQFKFIDAKGHVWNNRSYCEMLGRTVMLNAGRQAYLDKCADEGNDIVVVTVSGTCCPKCAVWENMPLSISGSTPGFHTVEEATNAGLFHPNCTHSLTAASKFMLRKYFKEGDDGKQEPASGVNSEGHKASDDKEAWKEYRKYQTGQAEKTETDIVSLEKMKNILGDKVKITPLTSEEKKAVSDYTAGDNERVNKFLYRNKSETLEDLQEIQGQIRNIDEAIDKCELQSDITIWRGTWEEPRLALIQKGFNNIPMPGFQSCSVDLSEAQKKARNYPNQSVIYKITVPKGRHAMPVNDAAGSAYPAEREVLLKSSGLFEIIKKPYPELENEKETGRLVIEVIYHEKKKNEHS